jgi:phospholipid/cholesterol/gamma-HCH transport system ATP-binding protein
VLDPQIILCDEPDSGLAPARAAYLSQLLVDLNAQTDATILIVTHNVDLARTVPDNIGVLFRRRLVMFGPREVLLTADEPVVEQFINGRRFRSTVLGVQGDQTTLAKYPARAGRDGPPGDGHGVRAVVEQLRPSEGLPCRQAERRRKDRVMGLLPMLPVTVRDDFLASLDADDRLRYGIDRVPVA